MLVQHIITTYAQISQPNLNDNMTDFNTGINPGLPLAVYTCKQGTSVKSLPPTQASRSLTN